MYHVNPPNIEKRVKYTITTRADNCAGYAHISRRRVCTYQDARPSFRLRDGRLGDTDGSEKGFARKQRLIRTKTPSGALARRDISSPDGLEALRTPFLPL